MKVLVGAACLLLAVARPLSGQMVVTNDTLDVERREVRDVLTVLRDSLRTVEAAAAQFERGHQSASIELLISRAQSIQRACARSRRNLPAARKQVAAGSWSTEYRTKAQDNLLDEMVQLEESLEACESVWARLASLDEADELRADGPAQAQSISTAIRRYTSDVDALYKALGIYVRPIGAGPSVIP